MIALKMLLTIAGVLLLAAAVAIPLYGVGCAFVTRMKKKAGGDGLLLDSGVPEPEPEPIAWRGPAALALVACLPLLIAASIVVVPSGMGGVRISQISGTVPGTLYPGVHFITPLMDSVQIFDLRDHLFTAGIVERARSRSTKNGLTVQSREGLNIGLAVTVRYRLDPNKLASVQAHLPQPADKELVPPVVASAWRELAPLLHGARNLFDQARRGAERRGKHHHTASWRQTASWWKR